jgi:hypothetical protein
MGFPRHVTQPSFRRRTCSYREPEPRKPPPSTPEELARQREYRRSNLAKIAAQLRWDRRGLPIANLDDD